MLGKIFGAMCITSFISALFCGRLEYLTAAALDGAAKSVTVTLALCGMMCLWCGVLRVLSDGGAVRRLCRLTKPLLRFVFPTATSSGNGEEEIAANISANILGMGNAATPFALAAMEKMQLDSKTPEIASDDMITLAVINCAPLNILPATLLALRHASGSANVSAIVLPIWIVSALSAVFSVLLARLCAVGSAYVRALATNKISLGKKKKIQGN